MRFCSLFVPCFRFVRGIFLLFKYSIQRSNVQMFNDHPSGFVVFNPQGDFVGKFEECSLLCFFQCQYIVLGGRAPAFFAKLIL